LLMRLFSFQTQFCFCIVRGSTYHLLGFTESPVAVFDISGSPMIFCGDLKLLLFFQPFRYFFQLVMSIQHFGCLFTIAPVYSKFMLRLTCYFFLEELRGVSPPSSFDRQRANFVFREVSFVLATNLDGICPSQMIPLFCEVVFCEPRWYMSVSIWYWFWL
jgi:hypothetical protein